VALATEMYHQAVRLITAAGIRSLFVKIKLKALP
jgi:hypothetical protein